MKSKLPSLPNEKDKILVSYDLEKIISGIRNGNRQIIGKAITLLESKKEAHKIQGSELLSEIMPEAGKAIRIGISGSPGVGKSTFIEAFGLKLISEGHRVAVLAIDPSSPIHGGSIMGDKTRMIELSANENSFIRPSPSDGNLGGVARKTREISIILEAAGYDIILIETVGVGQSEFICASMVDIFMMLQLPHAGDDLQGIKRGILELADIICINKSDGDLKLAAERTKIQLQQTLHVARPDNNPTIFNISSLKKIGIENVVKEINQKHHELKTSGKLAIKRSSQAKKWFEDELDHQFLEQLSSHSKINEIYKNMAEEVQQGKLPGSAAAQKLVQEIFKNLNLR